MSNDILSLTDKIKNINISDTIVKKTKTKKIEDKDIWNHILTERKYDKETSFIITADDIKNCNKTWKGKACQFEPRLLCYQTSLSQRPDIFKKKRFIYLTY